MVLSDWVIEKEMTKGNIIIDGYRPEHLNPNSYDLTLGSTFQKYDISSICTLDVRKKNPTNSFTINEEGITLQPEQLYLYACQERIGVLNNICATVMGKSSLGRLGLDIHVCAGFIDSGFVGSLVLELRTIYPLHIYPGMKICQIKFERTEGTAKAQYGDKPGSKYQGQVGVVASQYHKNFD